MRLPAGSSRTERRIVVDGVSLQLVISPWREVYLIYGHKSFYKVWFNPESNNWEAADGKEVLFSLTSRSPTEFIVQPSLPGYFALSPDRTQVIYAYERLDGDGWRWEEFTAPFPSLCREINIALVVMEHLRHRAFEPVSQNA